MVGSIIPANPVTNIKLGRGKIKRVLEAMEFVPVLEPSLPIVLMIDDVRGIIFCAMQNPATTFLLVARTLDALRDPRLSLGSSPPVEIWNGEDMIPARRA